MKRFALLLLPALALSGAVAHSLPADDSNITRVHIVAHSHEDPGWLNTSDTYYQIKVNYIITNVVNSLLADERRTFQYVEMWYFRRWWLEQNATVRESVRGLVKERRLTFLTGGLCMNDEATTHFGAIIDQMTWGHRFLNATFGPDALPTVGWQIDPYGHSRSYTGLTAAMGFDTFVGQKIDFQEWNNRAATKSLEYQWQLPAFGAAPNPSLLGHLLDDNWGGYSFVLPVSPGTDRILVQEILGSGKALVSPNGHVELSMQASDGNLVLRHDGAHVWSSNTTGHPGAYLTLQKSDGNLVLRSADGVSLWASGPTNAITPPSKGARAILQDNCNFVVSDDNGLALWSLGTHCPPSLGASADDAWLSSAVEAMVKTVRKRQGLYLHSNEVLVLYGKDFYFQDAPRPFEDMERVMDHINSRPEVYGMNIIYSSPMKYAAAVRESSWESLPTYDGDLYPSRITQHYVRTGYFTSRAAEKQSDRTRWAQGHAATLLAAAHGSPNKAALNQGIAAMAAAVGIHQHHDAITGTNRDYVADDYVNKMTLAAEELQPSAAESAAVAAGLQADGAMACDERNVSVCAATESLLHNGTTTVLVFNSLAQRRTEVIEVPVPVSTVGARDTSGGKALRCEVHAAFLKDAERGHSWSAFILVEDLAPLESRAITITSGNGCTLVASEKMAADAKASLTGDGAITASVSGATGGLTTLGDVQVTSALEYYEPEMSGPHGSKKDTTSCASSYALRPHGQRLAYPSPTEVLLSRGELVQQSFSELQVSGAAQVVRVSAGVSAVQLLHAVGPLDISNGLGQEPVLRVSAPAINSKSLFYTDSNGLEMTRRVRRMEDWDNKTLNEPVSQNYYPATAAVALRDASAGPGLSLVIDGARGASSQADGELETMLHRRHVDNGCRVDQGYQMDDVSRIVGSTWVQTGSDEALAAGYRLRGLRALHPLQLYFLPGTPTPLSGGAHLAPLQALPPAVHLLTLQSLDEEMRCDPMALKLCISEGGAGQGSLLLRLRHLFAEDEDAEFSSAAEVDVANLLSPHWHVLRMAETTLSAARVLTNDVGPIVSLHPMQIRTFIVTVTENDAMPADIFV